MRTLLVALLPLTACLPEFRENCGYLGTIGCYELVLDDHVCQDGLYGPSDSLEGEPRWTLLGFCEPPGSSPLRLEMIHFPDRDDSGGTGTLWNDDATLALCTFEWHSDRPTLALEGSNIVVDRFSDPRCQSLRARIE